MSERKKTPDELAAEATFLGAIEAERLNELTSIAVRLAPIFANGTDWSNEGDSRYPGQETDYVRVTRRAFTLAEAILAEKSKRLAAINAKHMIEKEATHA